jgi:hypothetical protein
VLVAAASVACQAAGRGELAILEDRGHRVASRQAARAELGENGLVELCRKIFRCHFQTAAIFQIRLMLGTSALNRL